MMQKNIDALACKWIEENKESVIADWVELCRIPSIVADADGDAPFGKPAKEALCFVDGVYKKYGLKSRNEENYYLIAEYGDGERRIGTFGHADVVPGGDGWKYTTPFEPVIVENHLIGRGAEDNKSGVMMSLAAVRILRDMNIPIKSTIQSFVGSAEEVGMEDIASFVKREIMPDFSLVPDASFPCCIGEKGIYRVFAKCRKSFDAIKEFKCGRKIKKAEPGAKFTQKTKTDKYGNTTHTRTYPGHKPVNYTVSEDGEGEGYYSDHKGNSSVEK
jgi:hypothetical protein